MRMAGYKKILVLLDLTDTSEQIAAGLNDLSARIGLGSRVRHGLGILVNFTEGTKLHAAHCDALAVRLG